MIFCDTCASIRSFSDCFGGVGYACKKARVVSREPNPLQDSYAVELPDQKNQKNDCQDYKKRKWWQMWYATCNG